VTAFSYQVRWLKCPLHRFNSVKRLVQIARFEPHNSQKSANKPIEAISQIDVWNFDKFLFKLNFYPKKIVKS